MTFEERCVQQVASDGMGIHYHRCLRKGALTHYGKKYCRQHYPPNVEARTEAREAKWKDEWKARDQIWKREEVELARKAEQQ